jgi:hypothetical protein
LLRKVWIADLLTAVVLGYTNIVLVDHSDPYRLAATWAANLLFFYASIWLFRHLGYTAVVALCVSGYLSLLGTPYISFTAWYAGRMLVTSGICVALAAWSLWVIVSDKRGTSTPSHA